MKKTYITPALSVEESQPISSMLVGSGESVPFGETEVHGNEALGKENAGSVWKSTESIWDKSW